MRPQESIFVQFVASVQCCRQSSRGLQFGGPAESDWAKANFNRKCDCHRIYYSHDDVSARDLAAIERGTQEVGRYLFEHLKSAAPSFGIAAGGTTASWPGP